MNDGTTPTLTPLNRRTRRATPCPRVAIREFPFRIGRESRLGHQPWKVGHRERRQGTSLPNNDLYLENVGKGIFVSREHLQIERHDDGSFCVVDRGSICGTTVGGKFFGGAGQGGTCQLNDGDTVILGPAYSDYRFRFSLQTPSRRRQTHRRFHCVANRGFWLGLLGLITVIATVAVHGFML